MRVLIKISGEYLAGTKRKGYDLTTLKDLSNNIKKLLKNDIEIAIVIGGGNLIRGAELEEFSLYYGHNMGMLTSEVNALGLTDFFNNEGIPTKSFHSIEVGGLLEKFNKKNVLKYLKKKNVVIFGGGTGLPYFTTDTGGVLRALEIDADLMIKATKINGVYDKDPVKHKDAKLFKEISYKEVLEKNLKVMDLTAISLAKEYNLPLKVVSLYEKSALLKAVEGNDVGTTITP